MKALSGTRLETSPLGQLRKLTDLIFFEGPLLSLFANRQGDKFLYYWCDAGNGKNRWLILRISDRDLDSYLTKQTTLQCLLLNPADGFVYAADIDADAHITDVNILDPQSLPDDYLAEDNSYYEFTPSSVLISESSVEGQAPETYTIAIDGEWTLQDLADMPKTYSTVYAFMYSLRATGNRLGDLLTYAYRAHPWRGGYSAVNFFKDLLADIGPKHGLQIVSMRYSSPGWIELEISPVVAVSVKHVVASFLSAGYDLEELYKSIYSELRERDLLRGVDLSSDDLSEQLSVVETLISSEVASRRIGKQTKRRRPSKDDLEFASSSATDLAGLLRLEEADFQQINSLTANPIVTLKILLSVYRRIEILAKYHVQGKAEY